MQGFIITPKAGSLNLVGQGIIRVVRVVPVASWVGLLKLTMGVLPRKIEALVGAVGVTGPPIALQLIAKRICPPCVGICVCEVS